MLKNPPNVKIGINQACSAFGAGVSWAETKGVNTKKVNTHEHY